MFAEHPVDLGLQRFWVNGRFCRAAQIYNPGVRTSEDRIQGVCVRGWQI
jgi:hypothetical protein